VRKDLSFAAIALVVVAAVCYVVARVRPDLPPTPSHPYRAASKAAAKHIDPNDKIVMHVNGEPVTESEFNAFAQNAPADQRAFYTSPAGRRALADELVKLKVLEQEGERLGIGDTPEVQNQVESVRGQIVAGKTLEKLVKDDIDVKIRTEYEREKAGAMTLRHILVAYQGGAVPPRSGSALPQPQALQKANAIFARLKGGADFADVAKKESDDTQTAERGGSLGATRPDMLPPDIASAVTKLKAGEFSAPVTTSFGIHIFKVETPSLDDLRPMLSQRVQQQAIMETVGRLQSKAKVELDPKFFPGPAGMPALPPGMGGPPNG
jgi:peptidyl-prolyl cis-trans isomerase C